MASELVRISMSLERHLYEQLEELVERTGANNRSEFIRDLLRTHLAIRSWSHGGEMLATISMTYNHHVRQLPSRLVDLQHDCPATIISANHVHIDHHICLEVLLMRGRMADIHVFCEQLRQLKGVDQVELSMLPVRHPGRDDQRPNSQT